MSALSFVCICTVFAGVHFVRVSALSLFVSQLHFLRALFVYKNLFFHAYTVLVCNCTQFACICTVFVCICTEFIGVSTVSISVCTVFVCVRK